MKLRSEFFSFRNRVVVIVVGVTLGAVSLLYTNNLASGSSGRSSTTWPCGPTPSNA